MFELDDILEMLEFMRFSNTILTDQREGDYFFKVFDEMDECNAYIKVNHVGDIFVRYEGQTDWGDRIGEVR